MKKISFLIVFVLMLFAQNFWAQKNIVGTYHISSGNPDDGGYNWMLFDNNEFAMLTFGYIISGKWAQKSDGNIEFVPYMPENSFAVYGRNNPEIKGAKMVFNGLDINEETYIATSATEIQPILNEDANCLPYPTLKIFESPLKKLLLTCCLSAKNTETSCAFDYELLNFNDFIVIYYSSQMRVTPFSGKIVDQKLQINRGEFSSSKREISPTDENEIKKYVEQQKQYFSQTSLVSTKDYRFGSISKEGFFIFEENKISLSNYHFDGENGIYTYKNSTPELEEWEYKTLNLYKKLNFEVSKESLQLNKKSLLEFRCE